MAELDDSSDSSDLAPDLHSREAGNYQESLIRKDLFEDYLSSSYQNISADYFAPAVKPNVQLNPPQ